VVGHFDKLPFCGKEGYRDFFEELCMILEKLYPDLNLPDNFDRYFAFSKYSPFKPNDKLLDYTIHF